MKETIRVEVRGEHPNHSYVLPDGRELSPKEFREWVGTLPSSARIIPFRGGEP